MLRLFALLGIVVFTVGVMTLASPASAAPAPPLPPPPSDDNPNARRSVPQLETVPALAFHARFSLN
jgi:hypothetical protein